MMITDSSSDLRVAQSSRAKVLCPEHRYVELSVAEPTIGVPWGPLTPHNRGPFNQLMSLSGGRKCPRRSWGGSTDSRASSFSVGSARR